MSDRSIAIAPPRRLRGAGCPRWEDLPLARRRRLLGLLTQLLERQLPRGTDRGAEGGHEPVPAHD
jgi:hypothetical protein